MVLCVVDDMLFASKIRAAASGLGVTVAFEKNPDAVAARIAGEHPSLVIFDLDAARLRAVETIAVLKADPATATIRTLGYVSHVQTARIAEARAAGIDDVKARSAFTSQLGEILTGASA
jgi:CheY-like chemotaxis protein